MFWAPRRINASKLKTRNGDDYDVKTRLAQIASVLLASCAQAHIAQTGGIAMQLRASSFAFAIVLLCSIPSVTLACSSETTSSLASEAVSIAQHANEAGSNQDLPTERALMLASGDEAGFAFPNWILLLDHEGESFTTASASQIETRSADLDAKTSESFGLAFVDLPANLILVDDDGIPLFSVTAREEPEATGSIGVETEWALDGYEDR